MKKLCNPFVHLDGYHCFGCAPDNAAGLKMEFYEDGADIVSHWAPQPEYQGWLGTLHGGIESLLLDEICGWVVMRKLQTAGVTSKMETRFLKPIHTDGDTLEVRARLRETRRNLAVIDAELRNGAGEVCTRATCTYYTLPPGRAASEMHFRCCRTEEEAAADAPAQP